MVGGETQITLANFDRLMPVAQVVGGARQVLAALAQRGLDLGFQRVVLTVQLSVALLGQMPGGAINDVLYDVNGRRFYVGVTAKF